jgi:hypothetical protein
MVFGEQEYSRFVKAKAAARIALSEHRKASAAIKPVKASLTTASARPLPAKLPKRRRR